MSEKKGIFGLFGKKEEEEAKKTEARKADLAPKSPKTDIDKAKADMLLKQKEMAKAAKEVKKHVVVKGDTLSGIAKKYYNDAGKYMKIYEANKAVIGDNPDLIKPGMELVIPKL
jgi:nucleoid-associated protein YgaU